MWEYNQTPYYDETLVHHGIKGMRWGVRRFQNKDGSLTIAGKRQYSESNGSSPTNSKRKGEIAGSMTKSAKALSKDAQTLVDTVGKRSRENAKQQIDLSSMSDAELREAVNRMNMEQQFKNLSAPAVSKGESYVSDTLAIVGSVAGIVGTGITIALGIRELKGKG